MAYSKLNSLLGQPDKLETEQMDDTFDSADSMEADEDVTAPFDFEELDPDQVLDDPSSSVELKKYAIKMIKEKYLKPQSQG